MADKSITSANAIIQITVANLYPTPQQLQQFSVEDIYDTDDIEPAEVMMGVDGVLTGGWVAAAVKQGFSLMADSPSNDLFEAVYRAQLAARDIYRFGASITLPSLGKAYTCTRGIMTGYKPIADAKKLLQPRKFTITWERVSPAVA